MSHLRGNISANLLANVWATLLAIGLTPAYVALLGIESYGLIGFYMSWIAILGIIDTGIATAALRETAWLRERPQERARIPTLIRTLELIYWTIVVALGCILFAAAWWFGDAWFSSVVLSPGLIRSALLLMVASLVLQMPSGLYVGGLMGLQHQIECSAFTAAFGTLRGVGALAVLMAQPDIRMFFGWHIVVSALQTGVLRWRLMSHMTGHRPHYSHLVACSVRSFAGQMSVVTALSLLMVQADKMILSRLISLEAFGAYMLAWTAASGLSRLSTPLTHAFSPQFTALVARNDCEGLSTRLRLASQLTGILMLPPGVLLVILGRPALFVWTGNGPVSDRAAPLLAVLAVGTVLTACSYPALSTLYSRGEMKPVIAVNVGAALTLLPLMAMAALSAGALGAAACWTTYGLVTYVSYQAIALKMLPGAGLMARIAADFLAPAAASVAVVWVASGLVPDVGGRLSAAAFLAIVLCLAWAAAVAVCRDLIKAVSSTFSWKPLAFPWSA